MATTEQEASPGLPVEVSKINRSLKQLWEQGGETLTKASLVNFAIYSEAPDALRFNSNLMAEVTRDHACRAILLAVNPAAVDRRVQAWITAHCHVSRAGSKQVCSEQVSVLLEGVDQTAMQNILFSNLDSDLPLYFWWQGQFSEQTNSPQLWTWVDRLFFDSQGWREPAEQMRILQHSIRGSGSHAVLCDLNWRRLYYLRGALAQSLDHPGAWEKLNNIDRLVISHDPEYWTTAVLLASWMARQLGWELRGQGGAQGCYTFALPAGDRQVQVELSAVPGPWVSRVEVVDTAGARFQLAWNGTFLITSLSDYPDVKSLSPAGGTSLASVVSEELSRGEEHRTYLAALALADQIWAA
ncbi:MAG: glucose-6-phosphate dehydrogenase assembly protein OpcA [Verrucomicrobia bacterium]|nr:glucose-6-phosphate dehydrogenase assembly protein OpcA [Verrucomicrobiota bacterium]